LAWEFIAVFVLPFILFPFKVKQVPEAFVWDQIATSGLQ